MSSLNLSELLSFPKKVSETSQKQDNTSPHSNGLAKYIQHEHVEKHEYSGDLVEAIPELTALDPDMVYKYELKQRKLRSAN